MNTDDDELEYVADAPRLSDVYRVEGRDAEADDFTITYALGQRWIDPEPTRPRRWWRRL